MAAGSNIGSDIAVTNVSSSPIKVPFDPTMGPTNEHNAITFYLDRVNAADGSPGSGVDSHQIAATSWLAYGRPWQKKLVSLDPGQTLHFAAEMKKLFDVSEPGVYTMRAEKLDFETHLFVTSNLLSITVAPDPKW